MRGPCKNCDMRVIGCHSTCSDYIDYKNKLDAINEVKRREWEVMDYSFDRKLAMGVGLNMVMGLWVLVAMLIRNKEMYSILIAVSISGQIMNIGSVRVVRLGGD